MDNLKINLETDGSGELNYLNYPSIIEKEDNDSYEI